MLRQSPRVVLAGLRGGSGKTLLAVGLTSFWSEKGFTVSPFKKGPDFIDAAWLALAAGQPCHNLDPFLMTDTQIIESFLSNSTEADISLIEGNRGLFDGLDLNGDTSTAQLGKLLKAPVILIVDVTMATRTMAALVMGCQRFDPDLNIVAAVLNRVAGSRQESVVRNSIEQYCGIPVMGSVPKLREDLFPERHMGLIPHQERDDAKKAITWARKVVEDNLDLKSIWALARDVKPLEEGHYYQVTEPPRMFDADAPRIGFIRDSSFWFYYPENLDQLKNLGAHLVEVNSITGEELPDLDAIYIGGGFPETQAPALAKNRRFRDSLRQKIEAGLPVYAECGGLIYLGEVLILNENTYPMVGALPLQMVLEKKPQGHGYTILEVTKQNPYYQVGEVLKGHEFHYTRPVMKSPGEITPVFKVHRGHGLDGQRDGLCKKNLMATYTHLHAAGNPLWGERFFKAALESKKRKDRRSSHGSQKKGIENAKNLS
ncbi:MAG: hydrogenobyrinic acid a,c-diamide synthase (glutamine-hydrolyzing) [Deltaproteobacteria bacterium]|nr:MAG: hydrogenobyrinic acid a,c-diamide synthase (glutamine-hydrolyzing) [Deltaproteobacteria bacterium]